MTKICALLLTFMEKLKEILKIIHEKFGLLVPKKRVKNTDRNVYHKKKTKVEKRNKSVLTLNYLFE